MAFRQSTHLPPQRQPSVAVAPESINTTISAAQEQRALEDSQEWVLFSPSLAPSTARTHTTSTERTRRTAGLSRVSDFGSFDTAAGSGDFDGEVSAASDRLAEDVEEDEELDSLDDGLHAFHEPSIYRTSSRRLDQRGGSILPTHDGLGTFPASIPPVQDQLWQFEQFNPRRRMEGHGVKTSVQRRIDAAGHGHDVDAENDRVQRIENWRMEQSRVLLDEIEKETRRRRLSRSGESSDAIYVAEGEEVATGASKRTVSDLPNVQRTSSSSPQEPEETESFWQRITRRMIRDLIGIDESLLSVIFGESLPQDNTAAPARLSTTLSSQDMELPTDPIASTPSRSWEDRLFERIARELDLLVHHLSGHPGAFSTYLHPSQAYSEYAGIPVTRTSTPRLPAQNSTPYDSGNLDPVDFPQFSPTLQDANTSPATHAALWGIEQEPLPTEDARLQRERESWERELDVRTVFRFIRNRFTNTEHGASTDLTRDTSTNFAMSSNQESARRAAIIRQHHPLVSRTHDRQTRRADLLHHHHHHHHYALHNSNSQHPQLKRPGSSCASVSTRKSAKRASGSSRNYWDIGGSVGSGSAIAATGGMGFWGEV